MIPTYGSSISGINAALEMLDVSADNTANLITDGYKAKRVIFSENLTGGVESSVQSSDSSGSYPLAENDTLAESSNVNLAEEILTQIVARNFLDANVTALKTTDEMEKSLLDILA